MEMKEGETESEEGPPVQMRGDRTVGNNAKFGVQEYLRQS